MTSELEVRIEFASATTTHSAFVACGELHAAVISGGFLRELGTPFLTKLYKALSRSPQSFVLLARTGGQVVGLIVGSANTGQLMSSLLVRHGWRFLPNMGQIVLNRRTAIKISELILYPKKNSFQNLPNAEIVNFCVATDWQGRGVGQKLFETLVGEFARRGVRQIRIVTGESQIKAQNFYRSVGAEPVGSVSIHTGQSSAVFVYNIKSPNP